MTHTDSPSGQSWHTVDECIKHYTCGFVTGYNIHHTTEQNESMTQTLIAVLKNKGYSIAKIDGSYIDYGDASADEISLFVVNRKVLGDDAGQLQTDLIAIAQQYAIESIVSIKDGVPEVIQVTSVTDKKLTLGEKKYIGTSHFGKEGNVKNYTVNGRPFGFGHQLKG